MGNIDQAAKGMLAEFQVDHPMGSTIADLRAYREAAIKEFDALSRVGRAGGGVTGFLTEADENLRHPFGGGDIAKAQKATHEYAAEIDRVGDKINRWDATTRALSSTLGISTADVEAYAQALQIDLSQPDADVKALGEAIRATMNGAAPGTPAALALEEVQKNAEDAEKAVKSLGDRMRGQFDTSFAFASAQKRLKDAQDAVTGAYLKNHDAIADNNVSIGEYNTLNEAAVQAAIDLRGASIDLAGAIQLGNVKAEDQKRILQELVAQHLITQEQADASAYSLGIFAGTVDELDGDAVRVAVTAPGLEETTTGLDRLRTAVGNLQQVAVTFSALAPGSLENLGGLGLRAAGGPVSRNTPYWVGEEGPELMVPETAGTIVPAHRSAAEASRYGMGLAATAPASHPIAAADPARPTLRRPMPSHAQPPWT
jgi:hypothetical protein